MRYKGIKDTFISISLLFSILNSSSLVNIYSENLYYYLRKLKKHLNMIFKTQIDFEKVCFDSIKDTVEDVIEKLGFAF